MAAFDVNDPKSIISPGGVGFDINCGVRLLRTNLFERDIQPVKVCNFDISFFLCVLLAIILQICVTQKYSIRIVK